MSEPNPLSGDASDRDDLDPLAAESTGPTARRQHLRNLVIMAFSDGTLGNREVNLMADRCVQLGLTEDDLGQAIQFGLSDDAALELPGDVAGREALMRDLIRMMAADEHLDECEKQLFAVAAARMGLSVEQIDRLIDETLGSGGG